MTKRIAVLLCAVLLLFTAVMPACALIVVEDENGTVRYSTDKEPETVSPARQWAQRTLQKTKSFWQRRGVLTVAILLVVCILGTVVVLTVEDEKKKQRELEKQPKKNHKE